MSICLFWYEICEAKWLVEQYKAVVVALIPLGRILFQVNAQLSFHGHRDSVKFFVAVPGSMKRISQPVLPNRTVSPSGPAAKSSPEKTVTEAMLLVLSGGEGYVDFRLGDGEETALEEHGGDLISVSARGQSTNERSHIMVWQVSGT